MADTTYILYHGDCPDGFGGAWAAWRALGEGAVYVPVQHGRPRPALPGGARVVLIDFAYPRAEMLAMRDAVSTLTVLDHHQTAEADLHGLDFAIFDMERSGARLAWDYFHPGQEPPPLIRYVEDRDLWRFALPESREINAALSSYPFDFALWSRLDAVDLAHEGAAILRFKDQVVSTLASFARAGAVGGHEVPIVNAPVHQSDVGAALLARFPDALFVAAYFDDADGARRWSLRSNGVFDVAMLAEQLGGGGHRKAAGFQERRTNTVA